MQQRVDSSDAARPIEHCRITNTYLDAAHAAGLTGVRGRLKTGRVIAQDNGNGLLGATRQAFEFVPRPRRSSRDRRWDNRGAEVITLVLRPISTRFQLVCGTNLVSGSRCSKPNPMHKLEQYLPPNSRQFVVCGRRQASSRNRSNLASPARSGTQASIGTKLRSTTHTVQMPIRPLCLVPLWSQIHPNSGGGSDQDTA